jgi:hypothetical protein
MDNCIEIRLIRQKGMSSWYQTEGRIQLGLSVSLESSWPLCHVKKSWMDPSRVRVFERKGRQYPC